MNAKKAKALRKVMRNMNKDVPISDRLPVRQYSEITSRAKYILVNNDEIMQVSSDTIPESIAQDLTDGTEAENKVKRVKISTGQIVHSANSQKAIYAHLKRELNKVTTKS